MVVAVYLSALVFGCCVIWRIVASTGLIPIQSRKRDDFDLSLRRVWLPVLASAASAATFLIIRFVEIEAPERHADL